jgi:hypothetical protein
MVFSELFYGYYFLSYSQYYQKVANFDPFLTFFISLKTC